MLLNDGVRSLSRHGVFSPRETRNTPAMPSGASIARYPSPSGTRMILPSFTATGPGSSLRRSIQAMINDALIASSSARTPSRDWASPERRPGG